VSTKEQPVLASCARVLEAKVVEDHNALLPELSLAVFDIP